MKTALVTGSSRGIGRSIADLLHSSGYAVVYSGTRKQRPENLPADRPYIALDISSPAQREAGMEYILRTWGRLDLLVNNAGIAPRIRKDVLETDEASFDQVLDVNLKGTFFMCQLAANAMFGQIGKLADYHPRIVNIGSLSAYTASPSRGEYCISKAGLAMVTQLFAARLAPHGIGVFEVRPGIIDTDMTRVVHDKYVSLIQNGLLPVPRFGQPEDVARMVLACADGYLDYSAGQVLNADGGFALRRL